ncbi:MAG TPA: hypothetical protein VEQ35_06640 [Beijerinckia sp.]|nr:hypothetical protein [Beijerinckia sp.]
MRLSLFKAIAALPAAIFATFVPAFAADVPQVTKVDYRLFYSASGKVSDPLPEPGIDGALDARLKEQDWNAILVDLTLSGPPQATDQSTVINVKIFENLLPAQGVRHGINMVADKKLSDLTFGVDGNVHRAIFLPGHVCGNMILSAAVEGGTKFKSIFPFACSH